MLWLSKSTLCRQTQWQASGNFHPQDGDLSINLSTSKNIYQRDGYTESFCIIYPEMRGLQPTWLLSRSQTQLEGNGRSTLCQTKGGAALVFGRQRASIRPVPAISCQRRNWIRAHTLQKCNIKFIQNGPKFLRQETLLQALVKATAEKDLRWCGWPQAGSMTSC